MNIKEVTDYVNIFDKFDYELIKKYIPRTLWRLRSKINNKELVFEDFYDWVEFMKNNYNYRISDKIKPIQIACKKKHLIIISSKILIDIKFLCVNCNVSHTFKHVCSRHIEDGNYSKVEKVDLEPKYNKYYDVIYDFESNQKTIEGKSTHLPICVCYKIDNNSVLYCYGEKCHEEFIDKILEYFENKIRMVGDRIRVCLISFNGSRYDDIFFTQYIRKLYELKKISRYNFTTKDGAIIMTNFSLHNFEFKTVDIIRYLGGVTSLKNAAKDLKVNTEKDTFPYEALNLDRELLYDEDGFIHKSFFKCEEDYNISKKTFFYERKCKNIKDLTISYCTQDVEVTFGVWKSLEEMYIKYINYDFNLRDFHGAPSLMNKIALKFAFNELEKNEYLAYPINDSYELWKGSIYGGWVGCFIQGIFDEKLQLSMVDICSHYPVSLTGYLGLNSARPMTEKEKNDFASTLVDYDFNTVPIFCCECYMYPPDTMNCFVSHFPQRNEKGELIWAYVPTKLILNSIDMLVGVKYGGWTIKKIFRGEIFDKKKILFSNYVKHFAKMKKEGKIEKNNLKTQLAKIGLNSAIGKFGEHIDRHKSFSVFGEEDKNKMDFFLNSKSYSNDTIDLMDIVEYDNYSEYIVKEYMPSKNHTINPVASIMYAYSRAIRIDLIMKISDFCEDITTLKIPVPIYGDTDSVIAEKHLIDNFIKNYPENVGKEVLTYNIKKKFFDYNVEIEDVFQNNAYTYLSIFNGLKSYMVFTDNKLCPYKIRFKGHRFRSLTDNIVTCQHGHNQLVCGICLLTCTQLSELKGGVYPSDIVYLWKFSVQEIKVIYQRFKRILNRREGDDTFSIYNRNQTIKLSKGKLDHKYDYNNGIWYPKSFNFI